MFSCSTQLVYWYIQTSSSFLNDGSEVNAVVEEDAVGRKRRREESQDDDEHEGLGAFLD